MTEDAYETVKIEIADAMARTAEVYGLNRSYGEIYGILYVVGVPMTLDELQAESGYAKSTVSNAMSALEPYHLVRRTSGPGEGRTVYFEAETDFWTALSELLEQQGRHEIRIMRRALDTAQTALDQAPASEKTERTAAQLESLQQFYDQTEQLLDLVSTVSIDQLLAVVEQAQTDEFSDEPSH